jgi:hypothetical protein
MIVVAIVAAVVAIGSFWGSGRIYSGLGRTGVLTMDEEPGRGPSPSAPTGPAAQEEIRQMLEAKSARREARGQDALDVDAEMEALMRPPAADAALRDEVRQLVVARNERRVRHGEEPLDVEAEVDRQLRELGA